MITLRHEKIIVAGMSGSLRILHVSDVHFSKRTSHENNMQVTGEILDICKAHSGMLDAICVTGDLISRESGAETFSDAVALMQGLKAYSPKVFYSMGNHEMDYSQKMRFAFLRHLSRKEITVLDNAVVCYEGVHFAGLTLPQTVYKNPDGNYSDLRNIDRKLVTKCLGTCPEKPCILLAHSPIGFEAYQEWGADLVLSGHVHGGIVRFGEVGLFSPERKFFPKYTKGIYMQKGCTMQVSAGIGKLRFCNPSELILMELYGIPREEGIYAT
ncbi:MAG: metallophosphoesterase [Oscillospiraceae bacterium]